MQKVTFDTPAVYGDHHVLEVRRILLAIPGVEDVYASSAFHVVEVGFDPAQVSAETITASLEQAGYLALLPSASENAVVFPKRQSAGYEQTRLAISFAQKVAVQERAGWPCPGMGILQVEE